MRGATFVPCFVRRTLVRNAELRVHDQLRGQFTVRTCQARTSRLFSPSVGIRYYSVSMLFQHIRQPAGNQSCFFRLRICRLRSTACPLVSINASQVLLYSFIHSHWTADIPVESMNRTSVPYFPVHRIAVS